MASKQRTTFDKINREKNRQAKQAAKRERRQSGVTNMGTPVYNERGVLLGEIGDDGELIPYVAEAFRVD